jgi:hypothetical protein
VSQDKAKSEFVPFIKSMLDKKKAHPILAWFNFTAEEVNFLNEMKRF